MIEHSLKSATCRVTCGSESGTGWLITSKLVITARHCILPAIECGEAIILDFYKPDTSPVSASVISDSPELDTCILTFDGKAEVDPLPISGRIPREGAPWQTFCVPDGKSQLGHHLNGKIAQVLECPKNKIDLDLSVNASSSLSVYSGASGAAVVCQNVVIGILFKKFNGTVGALSLGALKAFLSQQDIRLPDDDHNGNMPDGLASRGDFSERFTHTVKAKNGYYFLQGAHGYGKSTFCLNFESENRALINVGAYCISNPDSPLGASYWSQPEVFFDWLIVRVSEIIVGKAPRKRNLSYSERVEESIAYFRRLSEFCEESNRSAVLFVDGLNEIVGEKALVRLLDLLPKKPPARVSVVLTAPNYDKLAMALSERVEPSNVLSLPPLSDASSYEFCARAIEAGRRSHALMVKICDKAKGHPLYLRYMVDYANLNTGDDDLRGFPTIAGRIETYYIKIWSKLMLDGGAINLLALMSRLRAGLSIKDFALALDESERPHFVSVLSRIRHLLSGSHSASMYHASFAEFVIEKTSDVERTVLLRLATFCLENPDVKYCTLNLVHHLVECEDEAVFRECSQVWIDRATKLGVDPDTLIADVDRVVQLACSKSDVGEFFSLMLLAQRVSFRYDTLFAQSASLVAEALIALGRPQEALKYVFRMNTLIIDFDEAIAIAFLFHKYGHNREAVDVLTSMQDSIVERYSAPMRFTEFIDLCRVHLRSDLQIGLVTNRSRRPSYDWIIGIAKSGCDQQFGEDVASIADCMRHVVSIPVAHFLTFCGRYTKLDRFRQKFGVHDVSAVLPALCMAFLQFEASVEEHDLSAPSEALVDFFGDLSELAPDAEIDENLALYTGSALVRFGASPELVALFADKCDLALTSSLPITDATNVDVDHEGLYVALCKLRISGFISQEVSSNVIETSDWLGLLKSCLESIYSLDGCARRSRIESDSERSEKILELINVRVIEALSFTLAERAGWKNSYLIPENLLPVAYGQIARLLRDCFPERLIKWLRGLVACSEGQWGMYTEGFRESIFQLVPPLTADDLDTELLSVLLSLLRILRDHVYEGVKNRHELVPALLRMIPLFQKLGAHEEARNVYERLLAVSMGPSWYKEDQLSLFSDTLDCISANTCISHRLPEVAGFLERASGEMTFQRYVRAEKSRFIGQIARRGCFRAALAYFRRQCCGTRKELFEEADCGLIDKAGPLRGYRFPGGGLDDQEAILALVANTRGVAWRMRWALLEIFACGDTRYVDRYAELFSRIANEVGATPEIIRRLELVVFGETSDDDRQCFLETLRHSMEGDVFASFPFLEPPLCPQPASVLDGSAETGGDDEDGDGGELFVPGIFGNRSALRDASTALTESEHELGLGNRLAAKQLAVESLRIAQAGGWNVWGNLSAEAERAREIVAADEDNAMAVIRHYATLIEGERYAPKWLPAHFLIERTGHLLEEKEQQELLDSVIEHVRFMVGNCNDEIQGFEFMGNRNLEGDANEEFFQFIVWLCDHPQWLRRERAAGLLLWILEGEPGSLRQGIRIAFSMDAGYGPDVLCGVLDGASVRDPLGTWRVVEDAIDIKKVVEVLTHVSRLVVLARIAGRAARMQSHSAKVALGLIDSFFATRTRDEHPYKRSPPSWVGRFSRYWHEISRFLDSTQVAAWETEVANVCAPYSIDDTLLLEQLVASSFRESEGRLLSRWEGVLRYALNVSLMQNISRPDAHAFEAAIRSFNPSQPERAVRSVCDPFTRRLSESLNSGDWTDTFGSTSEVVLSYHEMLTNAANDGVCYVEISCVVLPVSSKVATRGRFEDVLRSSQTPKDQIVNRPFQTCFRLMPETVFFGPFTPPPPLTFFKMFAGIEDEPFIQRNWRISRRNSVRGFGVPESSGCILKVSRSALSIPPEFKLAWLVFVDDRFDFAIDDRGNKLT